MRYAMLLLIGLSLPLFWHLLSEQPRRRPLAFAALAACLFFTGDIRVEAYLYGWNTWDGTAKGFAVSPVDTLALALLMTRRIRSGTVPFFGLFLFYGLIMAIAVIGSIMPLAGSFSVWQFARIVLVFAAIALEAGRKEVREALVAGLSVGLIVQAGFVVHQKASGVVQASGTMGHQNILGMAAEASLMPLMAAMLAGDRRWLTKIGMLAGLAIIAFGGSRATLGFGVFGVAMLMLLSMMRGMTAVKGRILGFAVVAALVATPFAYGTLMERFGQKSLVTDEGVRLGLEREAELMANDYVMGVGPNLFVLVGNTRGYAQRSGVNWMSINRSKPTHNAYLLARAETGWIGEIALVLLLIVPAARAFRLAFRKRSGPYGEIALGSAMALTLIMLHSNYEFALHLYPVLALTSLNIGIIAAQIVAHRAFVRERRREAWEARHAESARAEIEAGAGSGAMPPLRALEGAG